MLMQVVCDLLKKYFVSLDHVQMFLIHLSQSCAQLRIVMGHHDLVKLG